MSLVLGPRYQAAGSETSVSTLFVDCHWNNDFIVASPLVPLIVPW
jgi:hypothetical protein